MSRDASIRRHIEQDLGIEIAELAPLGVSAYNSHYRLRTGDRLLHVVAYSLPEELPLKGIVFEHRIMAALRERGYALVPELVVHEGESLFRVDDVFYALTEWIDGCHDQQELEISSGQLAAAAAALADLHAATAGLDLVLDYFPEHVFVYPAAAYLDAHEQLLTGLMGRATGALEASFDAEARAHIEVFLPKARAFLGGFDRALYDRVRAADPTGIVHGDFRRMNVVFAPDGLRRVLDYNCCFNEIRLWDVAYGALSIAGKETVGPVTDPPRAADFIRAYDARAPLTADEWRLLPSWLTFVLVKLVTGAWESWLVTDRMESIDRFLAGEAAEIVRLARA